MVLTGRRMCSDREIVWHGGYGGWVGILEKLWYVWMMLIGLGMLSFAMTALLGETSAQGRQALGAVLPLLALFSLLVLGGLAGLLWRNSVTFDLPGRRYVWRRGVAPWARTVASGDFADLSHVQVDSADDTEGGITCHVRLVWADTPGARRARAFRLGLTTDAAEAAALAALLAGPLGLPVRQC